MSKLTHNGHIFLNWLFGYWHFNMCNVTMWHATTIKITITIRNNSKQIKLRTHDHARTIMNANKCWATTINPQQQNAQRPDRRMEDGGTLRWRIKCCLQWQKIFTFDTWLAVGYREPTVWHPVEGSTKKKESWTEKKTKLKMKRRVLAVKKNERCGIEVIK